MIGRAGGHIICAGFFFGQIFAFSEVAFAANNDTATNYAPLTTIPGAFTACVPGAGGDTSNCKPADPVSVISNIYSISIGIAAILAVIMIIWGGIVRATTESVSGKGIANDHIQSAFLGLLILVGSYLILRTINSQLVNINLGLGTPVVGTPVAKGDIYSVYNAIYAAQQVKSSDEVAQFQAQQNAIAVAQQKLAVAQNEVPPNQTKIKDAELAVKNSQISAATAKVSTASAQGTSLVFESIKNGNLDDAQKRADATSAQLAKDLGTLRLSNAPQSVVDSATAVMISTVGLNQEAINTAKIISDVTDLSSKNTRIDIIADTARTARQDLLSSVSKTTEELRAKDPASVSAFQQSASQQLKLLDDFLAKNVQCLNGYVFADGKATCK